MTTAGPGPRAQGMSEKERAFCAGVDQALARGVAVKDWWEEADAHGRIAERFELTRVLHRPEKGYSFFDRVPLPSGPRPVMGDVPDMMYDRPKEADLRNWCAQVREFVLRYFMRVSDFRAPEATLDETPAPRFLPFLSLDPTHIRRYGFGYEQLYYKLRQTGEIGKFPEDQRHAIIDVRELDSVYEWVVVTTKVFDFTFTYPTDPDLPSVNLPRRETAYGVLSSAFVVDEEEPEEGILGRYGFGYAMVPQAFEHSLVTYGPGQFELGFQLFTFTVHADGEVWVRLPFVVDRARRFLNLSIDPLDWGFRTADWLSLGLASRVLGPVENALQRLPGRGVGVDPILLSIALANLATGGLAARRYGISRDHLEKLMLIFHFNQNYKMMTGSLSTWRQIPDWLDTDHLPSWVLTGRSS